MGKNPASCAAGKDHTGHTVRAVRRSFRPAFQLLGDGKEIRLHFRIVDLNIVHGGLDPAVAHELLDGDHRHALAHQVGAKTMPQLVGREIDFGLLAISGEMLVDGGGRETGLK